MNWKAGSKAQFLSFLGGLMVDVAEKKETATWAGGRGSHEQDVDVCPWSPYTGLYHAPV
jgi:hypothetical protein